MTLRANITTTYRENSCPQRPTKEVRQETAVTGVHKPEGSHRPLKTATKTPSQGGVPKAESGGSRAAVRNDCQAPPKRDSYESTLSESPPRGEESQDARLPAGQTLPARKDGSVSEPVPTDNSSAPAASAHADVRSDSRSEGAPKRQALFRAQPGIDEIAGGNSSGRSLPLPTAAMPRIRQASRGAKQQGENPPPSGGETGVRQANNNDRSWTAATVDESTLQRGLTEALEYGNQANTETTSGGISDSGVVKHLQSEGVFGIAPGGRSLGPIDFIRRKQFEYAMDQRPFTGDDLLLETEKAIYETLNSDQSVSVSMSLLEAVESVNAYRNQTVRSQEYASLNRESQSPEPTRNDAYS